MAGETEPQTSAFARLLLGTCSGRAIESSASRGSLKDGLSVSIFSIPLLEAEFAWGQDGYGHMRM